MIRWLVLFALLIASPAAAHLTPNSEVALDFAADRVTGDAVIPLSELDYARGRPLVRNAQGQPGEDIRQWLAARIAAASPDGRRWAVALGPVRIGTDQGPPDLRFAIALTPPPGADPRTLRLRWMPVIDSVPNHFVIVLARSDFRGGLIGNAPQLLGGIEGNDPELAIDRGNPRVWRGFVSSIALGMQHIAEGHDHLLFLLTLLLPAPLIPARRRWGGFGGVRHTAIGLFRVVTAFTIGHSLTLIAGAALGWRLPSRPVEIGIALSILISALHAWRPLFPRREAVVAGGFGLIHGMAFATLIGGFGLTPLDKGLAIFGFNLGIEIVQLFVVAASVPALVLLAPTHWYAPLRSLGAAGAGVAAAAWLIERISGAPFAFADGIDVALGYAPWALGIVTILAVVTRLSDRDSVRNLPNR